MAGGENKGAWDIRVGRKNKKNGQSRWCFNGVWTTCFSLPWFVEGAAKSITPGAKQLAKGKRERLKKKKGQKKLWIRRPINNNTKKRRGRKELKNGATPGG